VPGGISGGHGTLRNRCGGPRQGINLEAAEGDRIEGLLRESLEDGAAGISTGLMYAPGIERAAEELARLCRVAPRRTKSMPRNMRSYGDATAGDRRYNSSWPSPPACRCKFSHLQAAGRRNWNKQRWRSTSSSKHIVTGSTWPSTAILSGGEHRAPTASAAVGAAMGVAELLPPAERTAGRARGCGRGRPVDAAAVVRYFHRLCRLTGAAGWWWAANVASLAKEAGCDPAEYAFDLLAWEPCAGHDGFL